MPVIPLDLHRLSAEVDACILRMICGEYPQPSSVFSYDEVMARMHPELPIKRSIVYHGVDWGFEPASCFTGYHGT